MTSQRNIPLGQFEYHAFLTHNWGPEPWENHQRVSVVNDGLAKRGLTTWFDQNQMRGDIPRIMTKGVQRSCVVVVFITKQYILKVDSEDYDACKFEFDHAMNHRKPKNMIPVLMERVDRPWDGPVGAILGNFLYVDMTAGPNEKNITELFDKIIQRIEVEVGPCSFSSLPNPTGAAVDELAKILDNAKLADSERQMVETILRTEGFDDAETILDMTEDHAKLIGIKVGHFIKISKAAKTVPSNPQQALSAFKHGNVHLDEEDKRKIWIFWRNNSDDGATNSSTSWNPKQNPQQAAGVTRVDMKGCGIQREDFSNLCKCLQHCPNIDFTNLGNNNLGDEGARDFAAVLPTLPKLTHLYLWGNHITAKGVKHLCKALPSLPLLRVLWLNNNQLGDDGVKAVVEVLRGMPSLTAVYLQDNGASKQVEKAAQNSLEFVGSLGI